MYVVTFPVLGETATLRFASLAEAIAFARRTRLTDGVIRPATPDEIAEGG